MSHQQGNDVGTPDGLQRVAERDVRQRGEFCGQRSQIRVGDQDLLPAGARQFRGDLDRRTPSKVVDIGLIG